MRNAAIKGVLNQMVSENANLVNAAALAESCGVRVHEARKAKGVGGAGNVISLLLKTGAQECLVKGTVLHSASPRLLAVDDIDVEAPLERNLIFLRNRDVPGVIGKIGTTLGEHKINIANFSLGRRAQDGEDGVRQAIAVVHVDTRVPENVLTELRKIGAVKFARAIRL